MTNNPPPKTAKISEIYVLSGFFLVWMLIYLLSPNLERFRRPSSNQYVPYSEIEKIEEAVKTNKIEADALTANLVFKLIDKSKQKWVAKSDVPNIPCAYLLKLDDVWSRQSNNKFGFAAQAKIWNKYKIDSDLQVSESKFKDVVGWNSRSDDVSYPKGYFPHAMYQQGILTVPYFSDKLHSCQQIEGL